MISQLFVLEGQNSLSVLWRRVMIPSLDNRDLQEIIEVRHPNLELHVGKLIGIDMIFC